MSEKRTTATTKVGLIWLDVLEKEFDKASVDLDVLLSQVDEEQNGVLMEGRQLMATISSAFAQLAHKCFVVFENNSMLDESLKEMRSELIATKSEKMLLEQEMEIKNRQLEAIANTYNTRRALDGVSKRTVDERKMRDNYILQEVKQLRKENVSLRKKLMNAESELFGARLASKYLDKELSGRIQQIQLLGKANVKGEDQDRLWSQLEAEIHLHRHKTVVRACRGFRLNSGQMLESPDGHDFQNLKKRQGIGEIREVVVERGDDEGLGISITGGKEHGIPILVSEVHRNTPASRCGTLYVGDAILVVNGIDLRPLKHADAAKVLTEQKGKCVLQVVYVSPEDEEFENESNSANSQKYPFFDSSVAEIGDDNSLELDANNADENIEDCDNISSITDTMSPSPNKYPGVAKLCSSVSSSKDTQNKENYFKSKETLIE